MLVGSCIWCTICKYENGTPKLARNAFDIGEVWNPVCCHGNKTVKLKLWSTLSRILLQKIKHFWYKLAEISFFTGAQPKASTGHKMQSISVVFSTLHCEGYITNLRYCWLITSGSARWLIEILSAILKSMRHGGQSTERLYPQPLRCASVWAKILEWIFGETILWVNLPSGNLLRIRATYQSYLHWWTFHRKIDRESKRKAFFQNIST